MPGPHSLVGIRERSLGVYGVLHGYLVALKSGGIGEHQLMGPDNRHLHFNGVLFQRAHFQEWLISGIQD